MMDAEDYTSFDEGLSYLCGQSDLSTRALRYMLRPHTYTSSEYVKYYQEIVDMLKKLVHTEATLLMIPGPIRVGMDTSIASVTEPGDKILALWNGYWGRYVAYMVKTYEGTTVFSKQEPEYPIDPNAVERKLEEERNIKAVHVVHCETENGILNPIDEIGEVVKKFPALYIVDSATAVPGNKLDHDKWGIDICYFGSHKGMNAPSGLTPITVSKKAWEVINNRKTPIRSWYSNLVTWTKVWLDPMEKDPHEVPHCIESYPAPILHAIRAKLDYINRLGEDRYLKKYELASRAMRLGMRAMGLEPVPDCNKCPGCVAEKKFCSHTNFAVRFPPGVDGSKFGLLLGDRYWITAHHASFGPDKEMGFPKPKWFTAEAAMRIGTINDIQHIPRNILAMIVSTGLTMTELGARGLDIMKGIQAANEVFKEYEKLITYYQKFGPWW